MTSTATATPAQAAALAALTAISTAGNEWHYPAEVAERMEQQTGEHVTPATAGRLLAALARNGWIQSRRELRSIYGRDFVSLYAL